jgi:hypothetical protein
MICENLLGQGLASPALLHEREDRDGCFLGSHRGRADGELESSSNVRESATVQDKARKESELHVRWKGMDAH